MFQTGTHKEQLSILCRRCCAEGRRLRRQLQPGGTVVLRAVDVILGTTDLRCRPVVMLVSMCLLMEKTIGC